MPVEENLSMAAIQLITQTPLLIVAVTGFWFARKRLDQFVPAFQRAALGFALLIGYCIAHVALRVVPIYVQVDLQSQDRGTLISVWSLAAYPLLLGGIILLARAVFLGRNQGADSGSMVNAI
jgi:uncharacterized membrane protein